MAIPEVLRSLGHAPGRVLKGSGFDLRSFGEPDLPVAYAAASRLIAHCVAATGCEHFGLLLGERAGPEALGLAGFLVMNAPHVGRALDDLLHYLDLHESGGVVSLEIRGAAALLGYSVVDPAAVALPQIQDLSLMIGCNLLRTLCGAGWAPGEVLLPRQRPPEPAPWTRAFRAPVRFDADRCAIVFPSRWLTHPIAAANPVLRRHLKREADGLHDAEEKPLAEEVRQLASGTLASGNCSAAGVARLLGVHERTLNRRLRAEGTSFKRVLDGVRYAMSRQLLASSDTSVAGIAGALGYAESSAFIRAFARWSGTTPERWRRGRRQARPTGVRRGP